MSKQATDGLTREAVAAIDGSGQLGEVLDLPNQLRDACWRVESANLERVDARAGLVVAGMGGSGIGGLLAQASLGDRATRPVVVSRDYGLPSGTLTEAAVLCASYSGNTEETLAAYDAAGALGTHRVVATTGGRLAELAREDGVPVIPLPGGFQPRAAVAYSLVVALEVAAACGAGPSLHSEIDVAAAHAEQLVEEWGPDSPEDSLAKSIARAIEGTVPVIAGAGLTKPIAYRWKCQLNENAKVPAYSGQIPELNHNEIVGWESASEHARFSAIFLDDCDLHPRLKQRIELTQAIVEPQAAASFRVQSRGEGRVERLVSLVLLGDLVSIYLAVLRGVDPEPVASIERLKAELAKD